jgi:hypothetical protein
LNIDKLPLIDVHDTDSIQGSARFDERRIYVEAMRNMIAKRLQVYKRAEEYLL